MATHQTMMSLAGSAMCQAHLKFVEAVFRLSSSDSVSVKAVVAPEALGITGTPNSRTWTPRGQSKSDSFGGAYLVCDPGQIFYRTMAELALMPVGVSESYTHISPGQTSIVPLNTLRFIP